MPQRSQLVWAFLFLVGCEGSLASDETPGRKITNAPGKVEVDSSTGRLIAYFEIRKAQPAEPGLAKSTEIGGACLLAQYPVRPKECRKNSDCDAEGYAGYCISDSPRHSSPAHPVTEKGVPETPVPAGTCWARPVEDEQYCLRGVPLGAHSIGPVDTAAFVAATGVLKWRVLTCLNGTPRACAEDTASGYPMVAQVRAGEIYP
jgi:hypothetical protein